MIYLIHNLLEKKMCSRDKGTKGTKGILRNVDIIVREKFKIRMEADAKIAVNKDIQIITQDESFNLIEMLKNIQQKNIELQEKVKELQNIVDEMRLHPDMPEGRAMMEEAKGHFEESFSSGRDL